MSNANYNQSASLYPPGPGPIVSGYGFTDEQGEQARDQEVSDLKARVLELTRHNEVLRYHLNKANRAINKRNRTITRLRKELLPQNKLPGMLSMAARNMDAGIDRQAVLGAAEFIRNLNQRAVANANPGNDNRNRG